MPHSTRLYTAGFGAGTAQDRRVALNVQGSTQQGVASLPAKQSFLTTAETQFTDPGLANASPLALALPPGGPCEQEGFEVVFSGFITTTQSATVTFKLYVGASSTIGSNTLLTSFGASGAIATTTVPFELRLRLVYDSVSGKLTGTMDGMIGPTVIARASCSGAVPLASSLNNAGTSTGGPVVLFTLTATFSAAATPNTVNLKDFGINH